MLTKVYEGSSHNGAVTAQFSISDDRTQIMASYSDGFFGNGNLYYEIWPSESGGVDILKYRGHDGLSDAKVVGHAGNLKEGKKVLIDCACRQHEDGSSNYPVGAKELREKLGAEELVDITPRFNIKIPVDTFKIRRRHPIRNPDTNIDPTIEWNYITQ